MSIVRQVHFADGLAGVFTAPEQTTPAPAMLLLHGFASDREEVGGLFRRLAEHLAAQGVASLRFDFRGCGASTGALAETTIGQQLSDAQAARAYLAAQPAVDPTRLGVLGFSLGGGIALLAAARTPDAYRTVVTWSATGDFYADFLAALGRENFDRVAREGVVAIELGWREVTLKQSFFASLSDYRLRDELPRLRSPLFCLAGAQDFSAAYLDELLAHAGRDGEALLLPAADHIFQALSAQQETARFVLERTTDWCRRALLQRTQEFLPQEAGQAPPRRYR